MNPYSPRFHPNWDLYSLVPDVGATCSFQQGDQNCFDVSTCPLMCRCDTIAAGANCESSGVVDGENVNSQLCIIGPTESPTPSPTPSPKARIVSSEKRQQKKYKWQTCRQTVCCLKIIMMIIIDYE